MTADHQVRAMTWNIWWRFGPRWQDRQHGLLETLRAVDADVVALQEVWGTAETTQAHEFAGQLGLHAAFAAPSYPPAPEAPRTPDTKE
jgi:endonuclease/exonuclease/phosphatase family metal-dependent hydrolase